MATYNPTLPDPEEENPLSNEDTEIKETGADEPHSNNTEENSEGRKEGKSYYEKLRELHIEPKEMDKDPSKKEGNTL